MKGRIKEILMWAFVVCFFAAFFVIPIISHIKKSGKVAWTDCPVCGTRVKEENIDPEYALEWLLKEDYLSEQGYFSLDDLDEIAYNSEYFFIDDLQIMAADYYKDAPEELVSDVLCEDYVIEQLASLGWTIIPPEEKK